jgi:hypothetical protein
MNLPSERGANRQNCREKRGDKPNIRNIIGRCRQVFFERFLVLGFEPGGSRQ